MTLLVQLPTYYINLSYILLLYVFRLLCLRFFNCRKDQSFRIYFFIVRREHAIIRLRRGHKRQFSIQQFTLTRLHVFFSYPWAEVVSALILLLCGRYCRWWRVARYHWTTLTYFERLWNEDVLPKWNHHGRYPTFGFFLPKSQTIKDGERGRHRTGEKHQTVSYVHKKVR